MKKTALLALVLALTMLLSGCTLVSVNKEVDAATPIVTIGDKVITKAEFQPMVDNMLNAMAQQYASAYGISIDTTSADAIEAARENVVHSLTEEYVVNQKMEEFNIALTEEEETAINEEWESVGILYQYYYGLSSVEDLKAMEKQQKLMEEMTKDVTVDAQEITDAFNAKVEEAKAKYEADKNAYGNDVINGSIVYYAPEGYRYVKNLLVQADNTYADQLTAKATEYKTAADAALATIKELKEDADAEALLANVVVDVTVVEPAPAVVEEAPAAAEETAAAETAATEEAAAAETAATEEAAAAETAAAEETAATETAEAAPVEETKVVPEVTAVAANNNADLSDELKAAVTEYATALRISEKYTELADAAKADAMVKAGERADEVLAKLAAGESFESLLATYGDDPGMKEGATNAYLGYPVCEGFTSFDAPFVEAAMALNNVGDVTDKVAGAYGYYIIQYAGTVVPGAVPQSSVESVVESDALEAKKSSTYTEMIEAAEAALNVKPDFSSLDLKIK